MANTTSRFSFENVTLLITHYNRSSSLERLLAAFRVLNCSFEEVIVSDDASKPEHLDRLELLQEQFDFKLITTPVNGGLGNNINKGQDAVRTPYTLYVQEDFVPKAAFPEHFRNALALMEQHNADLVRFYAYFKYPYLKTIAKGFSEMQFKQALWYTNHLKFYVYSDHPHLRRSSFFEKFGRYAEGRKGDETEFSMCLSFIKNKGKGLFFNEFSELFDQCNSSVEPSTMARANWREQKTPAIIALRWLYLKYRFLKNSLEVRLFQPHRSIS
ncbi:glycosyltransferase family 2 protein [Pontibacter sp. 13R65]|uniref:glycosyltransferase family 2 protein n=1 Tax=Pontibacter sp. 13R65 TaxID=3127458 RepID=UPI00301B9F49